MRRFRSFFIFPAFMLSLLLCISSCRQKDLIWPEDTGVLEVRFEWPQQLTHMPDGMTFYFFPLDDDGRIWRFDIAGHKGGPVELPYGRYTMISYNNDVSGIRLSDAVAPDCMALTLNDTDDIARSIAPLYRGCVEFISFTPSGLVWTEDSHSGIPTERGPAIICHPSKISTTYQVKVSGITGMERIQNASLVFHGVCDTLHCLDATSTGKILDISSGFIPGEHSLKSVFESFGPLRVTDDASLEVMVTFPDRHIYRKSFNVGDQIANRPDRFYVNLIITGLSLPDEGDKPDDDVGMEVGVDGWTEVNIDYNTGP